MPKITVTDILEAPGLVDKAIEIRRDIHQHPETAFEEVRTADLVAARLEELGITISSRVLGKTGVVGTLQGNINGNRTIGLRADMDALFIDEQTDVPHKSTVPGKMHACGHDGHTAMLLGAAEYLSNNRNFAGTVHFIFQPAEEGLGGARVMIEDGLFEEFPCNAVYGMHNMPGIELGKMTIRSGPMLAAGDTWEVRLSGSGGHGAMPHKATDPTMALAGFLSSISTIVARNIPSTEAAVVSVGHVNAGEYGSPNIIPSHVVVRGTARSFTPESRDLLEQRIGELADAAAMAHHCKAELIFTRRYPPLINHAENTTIASGAAVATVGSDHFDPDQTPLGGSEDFAFMLEKVPGAYIWLGNGDGAGQHFVHTPLYDFNDDALPYGVTYWVNLVDAELGHAV